MNQNTTKISKYLSYILRHNPHEIGLKLNKQGWGSIQELIDKTTSFALTRELIEIIVETNDKQRFSLDDDGLMIRANQGHSLNVDLNLETKTPPPVLFHGTAERFIDSIKDTGLLKQKRHHVHLSENRNVAKSVGSRYGKPVILEIDSGKMSDNGCEFYKSTNNVWLVERVPCEYISF